MKKELKVEITELFMARADRDRFFTGIIKRGRDDKGNPFVFSNIVMPNGYICAQAEDQKKLSKILNEMSLMALDYGIHDNDGKTRYLVFCYVDTNIPLGTDVNKLFLN